MQGVLGYKKFKVNTQKLRVFKNKNMQFLRTELRVLGFCGRLYMR